MLDNPGWQKENRRENQGSLGITVVNSRIWWCERGVASLTPPNPGAYHHYFQRAKINRINRMKRRGKNRITMQKTRACDG